MYLERKTASTPSQRHLITLNSADFISGKKPLLKKYLLGIKNSSGRNNSGKITVWHKGGGHKKRYRIINFSRTFHSTGFVVSLEYDPNRNAHIAAVFDPTNKKFFYMVALKFQEIGDLVQCSDFKDANIEEALTLGSSAPMLIIPEGSFVNCISTKFNKPAQFSRSAGAFSIIKEKTETHTIVELSSGMLKRIPHNSYATVGIVSNDLFLLTNRGKAGRSRWLNVWPTVRGVAMNPIDHPHGGGEGKKSGKGWTPWGKTTKPGPKKKLV